MVRKKRLLYKDIEKYKDNPYNTYQHKGLPPTPINNPGLDAISATLFPPKTTYYFFVADDRSVYFDVFITEKPALSLVKDKKVVVFKYKAKTRYRRKSGHRQQYTDLRISDISIG